MQLTLYKCLFYVFVNRKSLNTSAYMQFKEYTVIPPFILETTKNFKTMFLSNLSKWNMGNEKKCF